MEFKFSDANESPGLLFWQVSTIWRRKVKEVLTDLNITHTQYVILAVVYYLTKEVNPLTQKDISNFSGIDVMTVSKAIRFMGKKELIIREENRNDSRAKQIKITDIGISILNRANPIVEKVDEQFFSLEKDELKQFLKTINMLKEKNNSQI